MPCTLDGMLKKQNIPRRYDADGSPNLLLFIFEINLIASFRNFIYRIIGTFKLNYENWFCSPFAVCCYLYVIRGSPCTNGMTISDHIIINIIIIIIIIILVITCMQGIYTYILETNHVSSLYSVAAVLYLHFMLHVMLFHP
jgi:hypothetical protein